MCTKHTVYYEIKMWFIPTIHIYKSELLAVIGEQCCQEKEPSNPHDNLKGYLLRVRWLNVTLWISYVYEVEIN